MGLTAVRPQPPLSVNACRRNELPLWIPASPDLRRGSWRTQRDRLPSGRPCVLELPDDEVGPAEVGLSRRRGSEQMARSRAKRGVSVADDLTVLPVKISYLRLPRREQSILSVRTLLIPCDVTFYQAAVFVAECDVHCLRKTRNRILFSRRLYGTPRVGAAGGDRILNPLHAAGGRTRRSNRHLLYREDVWEMTLTGEYSFRPSATGLSLGRGLLTI